MRFGVSAGAAVEDGVDQGDADRAAEVSHHVEQAAGVRHLLVRQRLQRQPGRRQQAEHRGEAAQHLRPEHLVEIGGAAFERAPAEANREQAKPNADSQRGSIRLSSAPAIGAATSCAAPVTSMIEPICSASCCRT